MTNNIVEVKFHSCGKIDPPLVGFAVIMARHNGKWVFSRHRDRTTWEIPGGHREPGELIDKTAERELYEETGAIKYNLEPICIYSVNTGAKTTYGQLYYAEIIDVGDLPGYEICEIMLTDGLPEELTYPQIQPLLFEKAVEFKNL